MRKPSIRVRPKIIGNCPSPDRIMYANSKQYESYIRIKDRYNRTFYTYSDPKMARKVAFDKIRAGKKAIVVTVPEGYGSGDGTIYEVYYK